jgi:hypothetical protein
MNGQKGFYFGRSPVREQGFFTEVGYPINIAILVAILK